MTNTKTGTTWAPDIRPESIEVFDEEAPDGAIAQYKAVDAHPILNKVLDKMAFFRTHAAAVWYNKLGNVTLKQKLDDIDAQIGSVLWTNPKQTAVFPPQTITLSSENYDIYEIFYRYYNTNSDIYTEKSIKGRGTSLTNVLATVDGVVARSRNVQYVSATQLKFIDGYYCIPGQSRVLDNGVCVPVKIVGYKA